MNNTIIRIASIHIKNYKNVKKGQIDLVLQSSQAEPEFKADILALYGPNGTGKTAVIDAINIVKCLLSGTSVPALYSKYIAVDAAEAELEITFNIQGTQHTGQAIYNVTFERGIKIIHETLNFSESKPNTDAITSRYSKVPRKPMLKTVITTKNTVHTFGPANKIKTFLGENKQLLTELETTKNTTYAEGASFIFSSATLNKFTQANPTNDSLELLQLLKSFAINNLAVIDNKAAAIAATGAYLPLYTAQKSFALKSADAFSLNNTEAIIITGEINKINKILPILLPYTKINFNPVHDKYSLTVAHGNQEIPLGCESLGTLHIIYILNQLLNAYNNPNFTAVIDEIDEGVYEYLLGQIIKNFQINGLGQLIFTAHNLTPLEWLDKKASSNPKSKSKSVFFTTSNPENRYIRIKNLCNSNNLRDVYLRLISQQYKNHPERLTNKEELYHLTTDAEINAAFRS